MSAAGQHMAEAHSRAEVHHNWAEALHNSAEVLHNSAEVLHSWAEAHHRFEDHRIEVVVVVVVAVAVAVARKVKHIRRTRNSHQPQDKQHKEEGLVPARLVKDMRAD